MLAIELLGPMVNLDRVGLVKCVKNLDNAALLTFHRNAEESSSYVTLHDLQRDFVVHQSKSNENRKCHSALVEAFRDRYRKLYTDVPNCPSYLRRFMVHHLVKADMIEEALALLIDPDWISHRLAAKDPVWEIIRDYDLGLSSQSGAR
jgi:hypothetical protein